MSRSLDLTPLATEDLDAGGRVAVTDPSQLGNLGEVLLHLAVYKERSDVQSVVHCHPPYATAFAVAREPIPKCVLPEVEVFLGEVPITVYETPGGQKFADTIVRENGKPLKWAQGETQQARPQASPPRLPTSAMAASPMSACIWATKRW